MCGCGDAARLVTTELANDGEVPPAEPDADVVVVVEAKPTPEMADASTILV